MMRSKLGWVRETRSSSHFCERSQRIAMKAPDPLCLVRHDQGPLAQGVLRGNADRTAVRMAGKRLDASEREHEAASGIGPVGTQPEDRGNVEGTDDFAGRADFYPVTNPGTHECIMNEQEALAHRHAEVVGELDRGRPGSALCAIDDDEVGKDPGFAHRLDHSHELPWVSDTQLETDWLAIR